MRIITCLLISVLMLGTIAGTLFVRIAATTQQEKTHTWLRWEPARGNTQTRECSECGVMEMRVLYHSTEDCFKPVKIEE